MDWLNASLPSWMFTSIPWIIGLAFAIPTTLSVLHGRTTVRGQSSAIYRDAEPKTFWLVIAAYALLAFFMFYVAFSKYVVT